MRNPFQKPAPTYGGYGTEGAPPAYGSSQQPNPYGAADAHGGAPPPTYHNYPQHGASSPYEQPYYYRPGPGQHMGYYDSARGAQYSRWNSTLVTLRRLSALLSIAVVFVNIHVYRAYRWANSDGTVGGPYTTVLVLSLPVVRFSSLVLCHALSPLHLD